MGYNILSSSNANAQSTSAIFETLRNWCRIYQQTHVHHHCRQNVINFHVFLPFFSEWTEGPRNKVQPDQVEQDVGNYERQLFKLERQFANAPQPRKMANRLRVQVGEFKEKMPLIQTLFNPGLRDRHWEQISMIIGQPFKPEDDTSLNKIIEMDLMQHIPRLEQISEAASKEFSLEKALEKMKKDWQNVNKTIFN